jgi:uncharacterized iron-regulated membrane protein
MMRLRRLLALAHRWLGLACALLLLPACLTGSALVWRTPLDRWLNPQLFLAPSPGDPLDEQALRAALIAQVPGARVLFIEPPQSPGRSALANVANWTDPADPSRRLNEVFLDPATGAILGARSTGAPRLSRSELLPWLHRFHYTLGLKRFGMLLMGGMAMIWFLISLLGTILTLPSGARRWRRWLQSWRVRRTWLLHDLHRATSLWVWPSLILLSASSVYLNLTHEVFVPAVEGLAHLLPTAWRETVVDGVLEWQEPLHTGTAFGLPWRLVVFGTGLATVVGIVSGLLSWLARLRSTPVRRGR